MGNLTYSGGRYWEASEAANIPAATLALATSLNDRVIGKFASGTARDSALATLTTDQKKGAVLWTDGVGWTAHDGTINREVMVRGVNFNRGRTDGAISGGFIRVPSADCFFQGSAPAVLQVNGINNNFYPHWDGNADGAGCIVKVANAAGSWYPDGTAVAFYWTAWR